MKRILFIVAFVSFLVPNSLMALEIRHPVETNSKEFIKRTVNKIEPVLKQNALMYWKATTTGKKEWYKKYEETEIEYRKMMSSPVDFEELKMLREEYPKAMKQYPEYDPLISRQLDTLYYDYLENQIDPKLNEEIVKKGSELESKFNTFRAKIEGKEVTDNQIKSVLRDSMDEKQRKEAWEASKQIGAVVSKDLIALVKKRNEAAKELGFKNFYQMRLEMQEQSEKEIFSLLDELYRLTNKPYKNLKKEIDAAVAKKFGIKAKDVKPWHYEDVFFQDVPSVYNVDLDKYFKGKNVVDIVRKYYAGIGMPVEDILKRSDLYERKGKEQHAYCIDIDKKEDIRILANVKDDESWTSTMLHELGHAVYDKNLDQNLPYLLREPAHIFTTEAIAELFGRLTQDSGWLAYAVDKSKKKEFLSVDKTLKDALRAKMLIFARWVEVMAHFERALYTNPNQDLNNLWWKLVAKYQLIDKPAGRTNPDWAAKIHLTSSPVYYHNYLLGEIFASQITHYVDKNIAPKEEAFIKGKALGKYLKEKVFKPGDRWRWNEFVKFATGEELTPKYFAKDFF